VKTFRAEVHPEAYAVCDWFLVQGNYQRNESMGPPREGSWDLIWEVRRSGKESYRLYKKTGTP
jgi:hypothetical protein